MRIWGWHCAWIAGALLAGASAGAAELRGGGKLLLTRGVSAVEGAAGGGLASWALIGGNATRGTSVPSEAPASESSTVSRIR